MWGEWLRGREIFDNHTILFILDKFICRFSPIPDIKGENDCQGENELFV